MDPIAVPPVPLPLPPTKKDKSKSKSSKGKSKKSKVGRKPKIGRTAKKAEESEPEEENEETSTFEETQVDKEEPEDVPVEEAGEEKQEEELECKLFVIQDGMAPDEKDFLQRVEQYLDEKALAYANRQAAALREGMYLLQGWL